MFRKVHDGDPLPEKHEETPRDQLMQVRVRVLPEAPGIHIGKEGVVVSISRECFGAGFNAEVLIDGEKRTWVFDTVHLEPLVPDGTIPKSHADKLVLRQAWIFCELRNDAWNRIVPRETPATFRKEYGSDWKDDRKFDVVQSNAGYHAKCSLCGVSRPMACGKTLKACPGCGDDSIIDMEP